MTKRTQGTAKTSPKTASAQTTQTETTTKETEMTNQTNQTTTRELSHIDAVLLSKAMAQAWSAATSSPVPTPKTPKAKAERPERECLCGCGRMTKSAFAPGHDAKSKSAMRAIANGQVVRVTLGEGQGKEWTPSDALKIWAHEHGWDADMTPLARDKHHAKPQHVTSTVTSTTHHDAI